MVTVIRAVHHHKREPRCITHRNGGCLFSREDIERTFHRHRGEPRSRTAPRRRSGCDNDEFRVQRIAEVRHEHTPRRRTRGIAFYAEHERYAVALAVPRNADIARFFVIDAGGFIESYRNETEAREHKRIIDEFFAGGSVPKYHFRESEQLIVEKFDHADIIADRKHISEPAFDSEIR